MTPEFKLKEDFLRRDSSVQSKSSKAGVLLADALSALSSPHLESKLTSTEKIQLRNFMGGDNSLRRGS